jgi:hypothetical protein
MAFAIDGDFDAQNRFVANLPLITSGFSLGHDDSLIFPASTEGGQVASYPEPFRRIGTPAHGGLESPRTSSRVWKPALDGSL